MPIPQASLMILNGSDATSSCSVSSQTDLHLFIDGPPDIRVGRSDDQQFFFFLFYFCYVVRCSFVHPNGMLLKVQVGSLLHLVTSFALLHCPQF